MLYVQSAEPDPRLTPFISRHVQRQLGAGTVRRLNLLSPVGTMLEFLFANPYLIPTYDCGPPRYCPRTTVIGPITARRVRLEIHGRVEPLVVLLHPLALYRSFETPVSYLAEGGMEGHSVAGLAVSALYERLGNTPEFSERQELLDAFFLDHLDLTPSLT